MADIELIVKIPEEVYQEVVNGRWRTGLPGILWRGVENGTPLPKKIVDADKFINSLKGIERLHIDDELRNNILNVVYANIIEADTEERDDSTRTLQDGQERE